VAVSDCHNVRSHAVSLDRPDGVIEARPNCDPYAVTLHDPDTALLLAIETDKAGIDTVTPADRLPAVPPTVTAAFLLPATSLLALHTTLLSDTHAIASQPVAPTSIRPELLSLWLVISPCSVTDDEPVVILFDCRKVNVTLGSKDWPVDWVAAAFPTLSLASTLLCTPSQVVTKTAESDTHGVLSHDDCPTDTDPENITVPSPVPYTVTLAEPVDARFADVVPDKPVMSIDTVSVTLPADSPAVNEIRLLPRIP